MGTSELCKFIKEYPDFWEQKLAMLGINVKYSEDKKLAIFNYAIDCDFSNSTVREARGIILYMGEEPEVACWPFTKFGNYNEPYADKIDWNTAEAQIKYDGSIIKLWFNRISGEWTFSTNATIFAKDAKLGSSRFIRSFLDVIKITVNYDTVMRLAESEFDKDHTYIFELISPYNKVVIEYNIPKLIFIGERDNLTGEEYKVEKQPYAAMLEGGFDYSEYLPTPMLYGNARNLEEVLESSATMGDYHKGDKVKYEGLVVRDDNFHRVKIKTSEYLLFHRVVNNNDISIDTYFAIITGNHDMSMKTFLNQFPEYKVEMYYYIYKIEELEHDIKAYTEIALNLYTEFGLNRKALAEKISNNRFARFAFSKIDSWNRGTEFNLREHLCSKNYAAYKKFIPKYEFNNISDEFNL